MSRLFRGAIVAVLLLLALAAPAAAAPDRMFTLVPGVAAEWDGPTQAAANQTYDSASGTPCGKDQSDYCDVTLLNVGDRGGDFYKTHQSTLTVTATNFTVPANDYDV